MSQKYEKLKSLLKELFQLDQPDLDFGLYRIMHAKAAEVTQFLDRDLLPQVKEEFGEYKTADKAELEKEIEKAVEAAQGLGVDPETTQKVKDLRAKLKTDAVDIAALESEVYDHLFGFFRRYYSEGDFLSKRVYKPGVYAIPYEGEEVKLHWANADQYYIKTSEYLRDYAFRLKPDDDANPMRVHFRLVDAAEGEHGNVKAANGKDRIFILAATDFIVEEDGEQGPEMVIRFEYRPATLSDWPEDVRDSKKKPPTQKEMTELAESRIMAAGGDLDDWITGLGKTHEKADGELADYSRLRAHLNRYVARNTFDYFIHKDLGTFLRRELDFYIKNEVMHLDDIEGQQAPRVEQYLSKIRVIRRIAIKIITFLAHLEDFQKKLWLKKKFVVETNYCIAVGIIPEEFYPEIAANDAQRQEWIELLAINEIEKDLTSPGYSEPLTVEFLKAHPTLVVDTCHFSDSSIQRLVNEFPDLNEITNGVLVHGDNYNALRALCPRYAKQIDGVFIDPPYNTGVDGFPYKDNYQHSSWVSMLLNRLEVTAPLLSTSGLFGMTTDYVEAGNARQVCDAFFGRDCFLADVAWEKRYTRSNNASKFYSLKDNLFVYAASQAVSRVKEERTESSKGNYSNPDNDPRGPWISSSYVNPATKDDRPNLVYRIWNPLKEVWVEHPTHAWKYDPTTHEQHNADKRLYWGETGDYEYPRLKSFLRDASDEMVPVDVWSYKDVGSTDEGGTILKGLFGASVFDNPKPTRLVENFAKLRTNGSPQSCVLDFFAGSGTTGHAIINLNRADQGSRRFLLVEVGEHFDTVMLPRIKKMAYCPEWADGKPVTSTIGDASKTSPVSFKYVRLESYEDALNNLQLRRSKAQQSLLDSAQNTEASRLKEQYMLGYMLNVETEGSQSLLNVQAFTDPTAYKLKVKRPGSDETREVNVDLLETFDWLIGLTVQHIAAPQCFSAKFERDSEGRLQLKGRLKQEEDGPYWFRTVTGTTPDGRKTLVIWRKRPDGETPEGVEQDNLVLDEWFTKQGYSSKDSEFGLIYVNGTNNLENLRTPEDQWKVRLIEEDFHRLMFAAEGV